MGVECRKNRSKRKIGGLGVGAPQVPEQKKRRKERRE